jgi:hypothetical protein
MYRCTSKEFIIELTLFIAERRAHIALIYIKHHHKHKISEFVIENIDTLKVDTQRLLFYRKDQFNPFLTIGIKPHFLLACSNILFSQDKITQLLRT